MAHLQEVIVVESQKGEGVIDSPVRRVTQYWSTEGELLAEEDPYPPKALQAVYRLMDEHPQLFDASLGDSKNELLLRYVEKQIAVAERHEHQDGQQAQ